MPLAGSCRIMGVTTKSMMMVQITRPTSEMTMNLFIFFFAQLVKMSAAVGKTERVRIDFLFIFKSDSRWQACGLQSTNQW